MRQHFQKLLGMMVCFILGLSLMLATAMATEIDTPAAEDYGVMIYADYGEGYQLLSTLYFGDKVEEQTVTVEQPITALRVVKGVCYELNLDRLTLDGACPEGFERKLSATDNDLIEVEDCSDFALAGSGELVIAARSPIELKGESFTFTFPTTNIGPIISDSQFYSYTLGSHSGSFSEDTLVIPEEAYLFQNEMCYPDSGHPDAPMMIYTADDGEYLSVFFEAFLDNTFDHGKDFAGVHVKNGDEVVTYKVHTTEENEYGRWWFDYTNSSEEYDWEHMCYLVKIPLADLEAQEGDISLAFEYYGTAYYEEKLVYVCIDGYSVMDPTDYNSSGRKYDAILPAAGKTVYEPDKDASNATWWITNTGTAEKENFVLYLNNANITKYGLSPRPRGGYINICGNLTIELLPGTENSVGGPDEAHNYTCGIHFQGQQLKIEGGGSLEVTAEYAPISVIGDFVITDGALVNVVFDSTENPEYNGKYGVWAEGDQYLIDGQLNILALGKNDAKELYGLHVYPGRKFYISGNSQLTTSVSGAKNNYGIEARSNDFVSMSGSPQKIEESVDWGSLTERSDVFSRLSVQTLDQWSYHTKKFVRLTTGYPGMPDANSLAVVEKAILAGREEGPKQAVFNVLKANAKNVYSNRVTVAWTKVREAKKYVIYGNRCGKSYKYEKVATAGADSTNKIMRSLKKGTHYKYLVVAVDAKDKVVSISKAIHVVTAGGKNENCSSITTAAKSNKVTVKKGKTFALKAKMNHSHGSLKLSSHRALKYESGNKTIATVSTKGVITGKNRGSCYVYAYAQNGVCAKIKVTVK